ncbi:H-NS family nucleoid-associated regulatory protein [Bradyrhizobium sp. WSM1417]|jgi:DNA-binding protein H-NS|uniref:H-NS histone family protein n=1 Tax=Bradyrhizobium sp. WSM1417 TaxID=754500 RepID=UPI0009FB9977|nr:H-NS histone family protein [Bradyrhizobium sp. WSM1417]
MKVNIDTASDDELWEIYSQVGSLLAKRLMAEKTKLETRLSQLLHDAPSTERRRPYPKVFPKYQNPDEPSQTWSGRGKTPQWVYALLRNGKTIEDLRITETAF